MRSNNNMWEMKMKTDEINGWHFTLFFTPADSEWLLQVWELTLKLLNPVSQQKTYSENQDMSPRHAAADSV